MSRIALVIGNESYKRIGKLTTPRNDASAISNKLRDLGFIVDEQIDVDKNGFTDALIRFERRMHGAEASLFFYAGHGFQLKEQNYLAPVDIDGDRAADLTWRSIEVKRVLDMMSSFPQTSLIFLDACRESLTFRRWIERASATAQTRDMRLTLGYAAIEGLKKLSNTYVAFSTEPGGVAIDTLNGKNSPFAEALLSHIDEPGLSVSDLMILVRRAVLQATDFRQIPWDESSLLTSFHFNPGDLIERHHFKAVVRERSTPIDADVFLTRYPNGEYYNDAVDVLKRQLSASVNISTIETYLSNMQSAVCLQLTTARLAELHWIKVRQSKDLARVAAFLDRFPDFPAARERIADLHFIDIRRNPKIELLSKFIESFAGTEAATKAEAIQQRLRQEILIDFVNETNRERPLASLVSPRSLTMSCTVIVFDICLIYLPYFSDLLSIFMTGLAGVALAWNRRASLSNSEAFLSFLAASHL